MTKEQSQRIKELSAMSKTKLLDLFKQLAKTYNIAWIIGGPQLWTKDELIDGIMEFERRAA